MNKNLICAIVFIMMLTMTISMIALPAKAQEVDNVYTTYAYIGATPNPVGVGQEVLLHAGITQQLSSVEMGYEDLTILVENPDGTTDTIEIAKTDSTGGTGALFTPDDDGVYTLQTHFPEQILEVSSFWGPPSTNQYLESYSDELELVVQADPIEYYPTNPLPNEYWARPIDSQLRSWTAISGNWFYADDNRVTMGNDDAPDSPHILWTKPLEVDGGLAGGTLGGAAFYTGDAYEGKWSNSLVVAGKLYYTANPSQSGLLRTVYCVDIHTGEELWAKEFPNNATLSFGQIFQWESYNGYGAWAYVWTTSGSTWTAYDAYTGTWRCTITDVPSGSRVFDQSNGNIYVLHKDNAGWMGLWNWSALFSMEGSFGSAITGKTVNASATSPSSARTAAERAWAWNVTLEDSYPGSIQSVFLYDRVIGASTSGFFGGGVDSVSFWGLSLEPGNEGNELFKGSYDIPDANTSMMWSCADQESEVFVLTVKETRKHYGFSSSTGDHLWTTDSEPYLQMWWGPFFINGGVNMAYGNVYSAAYSGTIFCYDAKSGDLLWSYDANDPYVEVQWSNNWPLAIQYFADGKVYVGHDEHSVTTPSYRGAPFFALNATTGEVIWRSSGLFKQTVWGGMSVIGDSIIATMDSYDQKVYAIGKGPSATTVNAPDVGVAYGSSLMIKGTVMDTSPGTKSTVLAARFPNGVPAVSDGNMSDWMLYVYKQFAQPADVVGVEVTISVLDENGNFYEIGTTTTSADGFYSLTYTPAIPGTFEVYAGFAGSNSYYGSHAETSFVVDPAPTPTTAPTATPAPMTDAYVLGLGAGAIVAIVAIGLVIILMLRKR